jgi:hypothetical protein
VNSIQICLVNVYFCSNSAYSFALLYLLGFEMVLVYKKSQRIGDFWMLLEIMFTGVCAVASPSLSFRL